MRCRRGDDDDVLFRGIDRAIGNALIAAQPGMLAKERMFWHARTDDTWQNTAFEILGADILVDDTLKPWLLEFNMSPSLETSTDPVLLRVKTEVFADMVNLVLAEDSDDPPKEHHGGFHQLAQQLQ